MFFYVVDDAKCRKETAEEIAALREVGPSATQIWSFSFSNMGEDSSAVIKNPRRERLIWISVRSRCLLG